VGVCAGRVCLGRGAGVGQRWFGGRGVAEHGGRTPTRRERAQFMSGPKVIDYAAIERRRAEAATRRWTGLRGRADALRSRCAQSGHPECAVDVGALGATSSADIERRCMELEAALGAGVHRLESSQFDDRTRQVFSGLSDVLADLERRERAATVAQQTPGAQPHPQPPVTVDFAAKVSRRLASLASPDPELDKAAEAVLTAGDAARARLLYDDLSRRIDEANRKSADTIEMRAQIAELRAQIDPLPDPGPLGVLLDHATAQLDQGCSAKTQIQQARAAITAQLDVIAARSERDFVRDAVAESLSELGYDVADVDVETPETLVFRQSGTHGVRAIIHDGEIDLRAVRLGVGADSKSDRQAEEEFCGRVPGFLDAMSRHGVSAGLSGDTLPGLFTPETVPLRKKTARSDWQADQQRRPEVQKRTTR
jgi:hypothetical protein